MRVISWNINGLKNILSKSKDGTKSSSYNPNNTMIELIKSLDPDVLCLQEVRCNGAQQLFQQHFGEMFPYIYLNCAKNKKGYSGTAVLSKIEPQNVYFDMQNTEHADNTDLTQEGRIITAVFDSFAVINVYTPNSKQDLARLEYRYTNWEPAFRDLISYYQKTAKGVIVCGDLNVAPAEIDVYNAKAKKQQAGFTEQERLSFALNIHNNNLVDTFRYLHPTLVKYTWWSNFANSRDRNVGWRIDHFLVSKHLINKVEVSTALNEYKGSDHCPIILEWSA
jgi:exodeoxyribonuclease-3